MLARIRPPGTRDEDVAIDDLLLEARIAMNRLRTWCLMERERNLVRRLASLTDPDPGFEGAVAIVSSLDREPLPTAGLPILLDSFRLAGAGLGRIATRTGPRPCDAEASFLADLGHIPFFVGELPWPRESRSQIDAAVRRLRQDFTRLP